MNGDNSRQNFPPSPISIIPLRVFAARGTSFEFLHSGISEKFRGQIIDALFDGVPLSEHGWSKSNTRIELIRRYWGRVRWRATRKAAA